MGRQPCCDKVGLKKGPWTSEEDKKLINFILSNGQCCWRAVPKLAGLLRCGKSCRLRWTNYLRPDLKRGLLSDCEEKLVIDLHAQLGNRWSKIASHLQGRTDNEIKNHWNTHIKKKLRKMGIDPLTHKPLPTATIFAADQEEARPMTHHETQVNDRCSSHFDSTVEVNNGFCTDEVPLVEPHEILLSSTSTSPSATSYSSSAASSGCCYSSSGTSSHNYGDNKNMFEDFESLSSNFDWHYDMGFWNDDFINLDVLINGDCDINDVVEPLFSQPVPPKNGH